MNTEMDRSLLKTSSLLSFAAALPALALGHGAHVHSISNATLAIDQHQIEFNLQSPGANLVGFEHPPHDAAQADTLEQAKMVLKSGSWWRFAPGAACAIVELRLETPGFQRPDDDHHQGEHYPDHQHHDDREHHHEQDPDHGHAEFHLLARAECGNIEQLDWMEFALFEGWTDHRELQLDVLTDRLQQRFELNAEQFRVELD